MVLIRRLLAIVLMAGIALATPALAHKDHDKKEAQEKAAAVVAEKRMNRLPPVEMEAAMAEHAAQMEAETPKSWSARSMDWIGRVHPFAVHFPIALFPVAWLALIFARRRGDTVDVIRALVIVAGAASVGAAVLGWIGAGLPPDRDWIHQWHRWLGTGLGTLGGVVAIAAWRRAESVNSRPMVWTLGLITLVLLAQGWLGAALIHGVDHMNW